MSSALNTHSAVTRALPSTSMNSADVLPTGYMINLAHIFCTAGAAVALTNSAFTRATISAAVCPAHRHRICFQCWDRCWIRPGRRPRAGAANAYDRRWQSISACPPGCWVEQTPETVRSNAPRRRARHRSKARPPCRRWAGYQHRFDDWSMPHRLPECCPLPRWRN